MLCHEWIQTEDPAPRGIVVNAREKCAQDLFDGQLALERQILKLTAVASEELMIADAKFELHERVIDFRKSSSEMPEHAAQMLERKGVTATELVEHEDLDHVVE
ncbi:MAG: hypothetical protein QOE82_758 [Thermoanaerobaculia bacterium]|nr:hypothetical protein [Thermoanaerobaculia bacterium]